jgi:hypothetical protein
MKKHIYKLFSFAAALSILTVSFSSCSEDLFDEINTNPNSPIAVPLRTQLPYVQTEIAYSVIGGDMSLYTGVLSQLVTGVHAQLHTADRLIIGPADFNNTWNSAYQGVIKNLNVMEQQAITEENNDYRAIINILRAYTFSVVTDTWGDVPYFEAGQGFVNRTPSYDRQEDIYTAEGGLLDKLDEAIALIDGESALTAGKEDLIYGGNMALWRKAAFGLKAKFISRLANTTHYNAQAVIDAAANSFTSNADDFTFARFGTGATNENPWFQERNDRAHFAVSKSLFDLLSGIDDPRGYVFFDKGYESTPAPNGAAQLDQAGDLYTKMYNYVRADSPIPFYTYDQLMFDVAEAYLDKNQAADAKTAYEKGVEAAIKRQFSYVGVTTIGEESLQDYIDEYLGQTSVNPAAASLTKELVWQQNYISLYPFQSIEAFAFVRRTGVPNLVNPNGNIPRRLPYVQSEVDNNAANVPSVQLGNGVWWDAN